MATNDGHTFHVSSCLLTFKVVRGDLQNLELSSFCNLCKQAWTFILKMIGFCFLVMSTRPKQTAWSRATFPHGFSPKLNWNLKAQAAPTHRCPGNASSSQVFQYLFQVWKASSQDQGHLVSANCKWPPTVCIGTHGEQQTRTNIEKIFYWSFWPVPTLWVNENWDGLTRLGAGCNVAPDRVHDLGRAEISATVPLAHVECS